MGPDAAVGLIFRRELADAPDPAAKRAELVQDYEDRFASPYQAASRGYIDDVIAPRQTRLRLIKALELARSKRVTMPSRRHGNIPL
jgi:acetyl-CoA carboxylase carboxyltransferase component